MRTDLLALGPEALTQLSNAGLYKRAQREFDGGYRPELRVADDGAVHGRYADGVEASLPAGASLREGRCTCGAAGICRHRLALVLAYRLHASAASATPAAPADPSSIDEAALVASLPRAIVEAARRLTARGLVVDVERASAADPIATARLPTATVRFLAGADLAFARCDCALGERCEHVVLAVRAFRLAAERDTDAPRARVELGARDDATAEQWPAVDALVALVVERGVAAGAATHAAALTAAFDEARERRATWLTFALEALQEWLHGFDARSARYRSEDGIALVAELAARTRAANGAGALSRRDVLGVDEPMESELGRTRLVSLGARVQVDGGTRVVRVALIDPDTGTRLVVRHESAVAAEAAPGAIERLRVASGVALGALARGQIVATTLRRRANGELKIGATWGGRLSLTPQNGDWRTLPAAAVIRDLAAWRDAEREAVPGVLRPRHGLADFRVIAFDTVRDVAYDPVEQCLTAWCEDAAGNAFALVREHDGAAPGALDALYAALTGATGAPRFVAGPLRRDGAFVRVDPWSVATTTRLCVPDTENATGALAAAPVGRLPRAHDPLASVLHDAALILAEALHRGLRDAGEGWRERARSVARRLDEAGLATLAAGCGEVAKNAQSAVVDNALRLLLLRERL